MSGQCIEITEDEHGLTVRLGERYAPHLTKDEALWCVAVLLVKGLDQPHHWMRTASQYEAADDARAVRHADS